MYNGVHFEVAVPDAFICDAPARAYLKCVKGHTGYYGCERCTVKGVHENRRVTFPELSAELRTDEKFRDQRYEELQVGVSPLNELGVGLVTSFVKSKRKITWEANHFDHSTFHTISKISGG